MNRRTVFAALLLITAAAALLLRIPYLNLRPMHTDEAVHTVKFAELWQTGRYVYDPHEYHGPTLYYFTLPSVWLAGLEDYAQTEAATYRIVPVIFGVGLILLLWLVADGLGRPAAICAGVLTAVSPALVFYSQYYIQEMLLVFFSFLIIAAGWRYAQTGRIGWALLAGAGVGFMHATKETCLIAAGAMAAALVLTTLGQRRRARGTDEKRTVWALRHLLAGLAVAVVVSAALYSALFTNLQGPWESLRAYGTYFARAGGGAHDHPWHFYLRTLAGSLWGGVGGSEAPMAILAIGGLVVALRRNLSDGRPTTFVRFLALYTVVMFAVYSAIPYKTPWCVLGILHPMLLLAGVAVMEVIRSTRHAIPRAATCVAVLAIVGHLSRQSWLTSTRFCADHRNPYVYGATVPDIDNLVVYLSQLATVHPHGRDMLIKVIADNPWPLPWYLRRFERVGYWETVPPDPDAPVVIVSQELRPALDERVLNEYWRDGYYGLRRDAVVSAYVDVTLRKMFANRLRRSAPAARQATLP